MGKKFSRKNKDFSRKIKFIVYVCVCVFATRVSRLVEYRSKMSVEGGQLPTKYDTIISKLIYQCWINHPLCHMIGNTYRFQPGDPHGKPSYMFYLFADS